MRYSISTEVRRRHAQRVAAGLVSTMLDLPSMSHEDRDMLLADVDQRGLTDELATMLEEELEVDAAGARDLADEAPIQADLCRRRAAGWRAARRTLRLGRRRAPTSRTDASSRRPSRTSRASEPVGDDRRPSTTSSASAEPAAPVVGGSVEALLAELTAEIGRLRVEVEALGERLRSADRSVLTLDEAADYLGVHRRTVERHIAARRIRATKLAPGDQGSVRVLRSRLDEFLERRTR